ncbi:hypothetical protein CBG25_11810, partial [Arsenophonus sp. ENCA]|uniref:hypothetical protein n=1 Tax=Arsenophonus sp. ENCA TaxID=1987579 RepID=UPI000BDCED6C
ILNQRKSMVEPVFSALRGIQGLERFRRKGLLAVKLEFTLHAISLLLNSKINCDLQKNQLLMIK